MWNQRKYIKTVQLDPKTNVVVMLTAPGYSTSNAKNAEIEASMVCHGVALAHEIGLVPDDKEEPKDTTSFQSEQTAELTSKPHVIDDF